MRVKRYGYGIVSIILEVPALVFVMSSMLKDNTVLVWISGMILMFVVFSTILGIMKNIQIRNLDYSLNGTQIQLLTTVGDIFILITLSYGLDDLFGVKLNVALSLLISIFMYAIMCITSIGIAALITAIDFDICKRELLKGEKNNERN